MIAMKNVFSLSNIQLFIVSVVVEDIFIREKYQVPGAGFILLFALFFQGQITLLHTIVKLSQFLETISLHSMS